MELSLWSCDRRCYSAPTHHSCSKTLLTWRQAAPSLSSFSFICYSSPFFGELPALILQKIERICKRAHRIICYHECKCSNFPDVTLLREKLGCKLLIDCEIPTHPLHSFVPSRLPITRKFRQPFCSTSTCRRFNSFFRYTCEIFSKKCS